MINDVLPARGASQGGSVIQITRNQLDSGRFERLSLMRRANQGGDTIATLEQRTDEMAADKPGGPGDESLHDCQFLIVDCRLSKCRRENPGFPSNISKAIFGRNRCSITFGNRP